MRPLGDAGLRSPNDRMIPCFLLQLGGGCPQVSTVCWGWQGTLEVLVSKFLGFP